MNMNKKLLVVATALLLNLPAYADRVETLEQTDFVSQKSAAETAFLGKGSQAFSLNIPELKIDLTSPMVGIQKTGSIYTLPTPIASRKIHWESVAGGYVARIHLFANQAKRLRYHVVFNQPILSIKFRVKGNMDAAPLEPIDYTAVQGNDLWLPVTNGNDADLEIFVDESVSPEASFNIDAVNIIVVDKNAGSVLKSLGQAKHPEVDIACASDTKIYPVIQKAANATAKLNTIKPDGSYMCSGTLLNDKSGSKTPWLATANHCISSQAEADATSFEWFYQAATCKGSATDSRYKQTSGGGKLLWADANYEASLLKLNAQPPNGVAFMGWESAPLKVKDDAVGIHHPAGDHTMISIGAVTTLAAPVNVDGKTYDLNVVQYEMGGVEGGSSGSGLFTISTNDLIWRGTLTGAGIEDYQQASYSDFSKYYPNIKQWIAGEPSVTSNPEIEKFYTKYPKFFGQKSGGNYVCSTVYTCQKFVNNKIIAAHNTSKVVYWSDGKKWYLGK